jgi:hypothetical protein
MRMLLSVALVFVMAGSAQAQQTQPVTAGDVPAAEAVPAQAPAPVNLQKQTTELKTVEPTERPGQATSSVVVEATNAAYADAVLQPSPTTRSWWYLVGAIVAAGIILYVIL